MALRIDAKDGLYSAADDPQAKEHKLFEKRIPDFLEDRLCNRDLEQFLDHLADCPQCRDELSIQYLVYEGVPRLETGETFNLQEELGGYVNLERKRLHGRKRLSLLALLFELVTVLAAAAVAILFFLFL